jgi:hypothetical protein
MYLVVVETLVPGATNTLGQLKNRNGNPEEVGLPYRFRMWKTCGQVAAHRRVRSNFG